METCEGRTKLTGLQKWGAYRDEGVLPAQGTGIGEHRIRATDRHHEILEMGQAAMEKVKTSCRLAVRYQCRRGQSLSVGQPVLERSTYTASESVRLILVASYWFLKRIPLRQVEAPPMVSSRDGETSSETVVSYLWERSIQCAMSRVRVRRATAEMTEPPFLGDDVRTKGR